MQRKFIERLKPISEKIELKLLVDCDVDVINGLLVLRNLEAIRNNMYTNHIITQQEHNNWIKKQTENTSEEFYAVIYQGNLAGGASLSKIDRHNKRAEWAFYLDPKMQGKGLGAGLEYKILEVAFKIMKLNKLDCEVLEFNTSVISMHKRFGFREEGCRRARILRNNKPIDTILLGITANEWYGIKNG